MRKAERIPTKFAPAERISKDELWTKSNQLATMPFLNHFLDSVPDFIVLLNKERQIILANKSLLDFIGQKEIGSVLGLRTGEALNCIHSHETDGGCGTTEFCSTCGAVNAFLVSQRGKTSIQECRITRQENGDALDLRVWASPFDLNGEQFTILVLVDISNEKRRRALERIFFHDVTNTLGGLLGFAELLKEAKSEESGEYRDAIYRLVDRLVEEINAQRELTSAENNELSLHSVSIDSISILQETADLYKSHEISKRHHISIDPDSSQVSFVTDKNLLARIIGNMTKNALEASKPGETITLNCKSGETEIKFAVHNPGFMPRETQLQVFQRSFSTKGIGRGLGTYSMKLLGEHYLKGKVSFETSPDTGTTFKISLPLVPNSKVE